MLKGACIPIRVHTVVISVQHSEDISLEQIRKDLMEKVVRAVIPAKYLDDRTVYHLNPSGKFVIGGPQVSWFCIYKIQLYSFLCTSLGQRAMFNFQDTL